MSCIHTTYHEDKPDIKYLTTVVINKFPEAAQDTTNLATIYCIITGNDSHRLFLTDNLLFNTIFAEFR